jgi:pyrroline-5-carboxylate reductase
VGEGAAGVYAEDVDDSQRELVNGILSSMCRVVEWVDKEELINVVTSVSGKPSRTNRTRDNHQH